MDRVYVIRHKWNDEGLSIRQIARDLGVSRNTVRKYVGDGGEPRRRASPQRPRPALDGVRTRIDEILQEWSARTTGKQRITGTLVHTQLLREGYRVGSTTVRAYLAERRRQRQEVYLPLIWRPGEAAQVDFFDVTVEVAGERRKAWLFVVHLMYSRRDFAWLYERCNQIAFLDGHVRAFEHLGGVVARCIYDNLKAAVKRRLGIERELSGRFAALCTHYLFEPCFARPGEGHDKGGVEASGKNVRLQHLPAALQHYQVESTSASSYDALLLGTASRTTDERSGRRGDPGPQRGQHPTPGRPRSPGRSALGLPARLKTLKLPAMRREYSISSRARREYALIPGPTRSTCGNCSTSRSVPAKPAPPRGG